MCNLKHIFLGIGIIIMFGWFKKKKKYSDEKESQLEDEWYEQKSQLMEGTLGKEHDMVMHALIPFELGGGLDLYYYPNGIKGTGIATKELAFACRESSRNSKFKKFELVMFTNQKLNMDQAKDEATPFGLAHSNINQILNCMAPYSSQAELNPRETCEFPKDMEDIGGKCLIFDSYETATTKPNNENFGIMLIIEIFRDEMEFAMNEGGQKLLDLLKENDVYPYSDLDRPSVLSHES